MWVHRVRNYSFKKWTRCISKILSFNLTSSISAHITPLTTAMSLRPTLTALREPARSIRALSSTISLSVPLSPDQTSSTASLLSLNKPKPRGSGTRYDPQRVNTASALLDKFKNRGARNVKSQQADFNRMNEQKLSGQYLREMPRRWQVGDVYSPHDLSPVEMDKWRRKNARQGDVIDALGLKPLDMYKVPFFPPPSHIYSSRKY